MTNGEVPKNGRAGSVSDGFGYLVLLVPTLCVGTHVWTLCVPEDTGYVSIAC